MGNYVHHFVYPISPCGGKLGNNTELRYSLRSLEKHFKGDYDVSIVSSELPDWAQGIEHIKCDGNLKAAIRAAADKYPDGFTWIYDDCCLIQDTDEKKIKETPACKNYGVVNTNWGKKLTEIKNRLEKDGIKPWDYSRPHGPYWYDKSMIDEAFDAWPKMSSKFPFESWILSVRDWPRVHGAVVQHYGAFKPRSINKARYLNYSDGGFTTELQCLLDELFPLPSKFEIEMTDLCKLKVDNPDRYVGAFDDSVVPVSFKGAKSEWARLKGWIYMFDKFLRGDDEYLLVSDSVDRATLETGVTVNFRAIRDPFGDRTLAKDLDHDGKERLHDVLFSRAGVMRLYDHAMTRGKFPIEVVFSDLRKFDKADWMVGKLNKLKQC